MRKLCTAAVATALTLLLVGSAFAAVAGGTFRGRTTQNGPVSITVKRGSVTAVTAGVVGSCLAGSKSHEQWIHTFHKKVKIKHGRIEFHMSQKSNFAIDLSARLKDKKISGTVQEANPDTCLSPKLAFTATLHKA